MLIRNHKYAFHLLNVLLVVFILLSSSCSNKKHKKADANPAVKKDLTFDESKWKTKKGWDYPYRDSMLEDVISNKSFRAYRKEEVLNVFGEPTRMDNDYLFYRISQKRYNLFPLHTKTLVIKLYEDSTIQWMKIHE